MKSIQQILTRQEGSGLEQVRDRNPGTWKTIPLSLVQICSAVENNKHVERRMGGHNGQYAFFICIHAINGATYHRACVHHVFLWAGVQKLPFQ